MQRSLTVFAATLHCRDASYASVCAVAREAPAYNTRSTGAWHTRTRPALCSQHALRDAPQLAAVSAQQATEQQRKQEKALLLRKTEICKNYLRNTCRYTPAACMYAHGVSDLRTVSIAQRSELGLVPNLSTYKTVHCWNWLISGTCKYGAKCAFVHYSAFADVRTESSNCKREREALFTQSDASLPPTYSYMERGCIRKLAAFLEDHSACDTGSEQRMNSMRRLPVFRALVT